MLAASAAACGRTYLGELIALQLGPMVAVAPQCPLLLDYHLQHHRYFCKFNDYENRILIDQMNMTYFSVRFLRRSNLSGTILSRRRLALISTPRTFLAGKFSKHFWLLWVSFWEYTYSSSSLTRSPAILLRQDLRSLVKIHSKPVWV